MYEYILERERKISWIYGNVTCATYPLEHIDTIAHDGEINTNSAIYHIVYGVRTVTEYMPMAIVVVLSFSCELY